jgi:hypothetical protein
MPADGGPAAAELSLPTLLSLLLVAFTIELDNEFEQQLPHRTARGPAARSGQGPWLVSMAMWANFLGLSTRTARRCEISRSRRA